MKTIRLIKARSQKTAPQNAADGRPSVPLAARELVQEWVREYQVGKPVNPRAQFAGLFKAAV